MLNPLADKIMWIAVIAMLLLILESNDVFAAERDDAMGGWTPQGVATMSCIMRPGCTEVRVTGNELGGWTPARVRALTASEPVIRCRRDPETGWADCGYYRGARLEKVCRYSYDEDGQIKEVCREPK